MGKFQSTPPVWGATRDPCPSACSLPISIHAPRVGGDSHQPWRLLPSHYFNPRPPCGGRRATVEPITLLLCYFNPRPPCGGRPFGSASIHQFQRHFNPRPPCGGRQASRIYLFAFIYFNPRPPCGGRHFSTGCPFQYINFNPRPPCGGRRIDCLEVKRHDHISIHAPRVGGDRTVRTAGRFGIYFNPRPPCGGRPI